MSLRLTLAAAVAAAATLAAAGAQASTIYSNPTDTGQLPTDSAPVTYTFASTGGLATLSFVLDGYASLDGQNWYEDDFTLSLNNTAIFSGTFNLGGGGNDVVFTFTPGASANNVSGNGTDVTWAGGHVNISTPLALVDGANTLSFSYHSLTDDHANWQGMGDEGWGLHDVLVTSGAVPEPATWGLMIMGFGGMGAMLRRQRRQAAVATA